VFHWSTFGLPLESRVNEFVPYTLIGWYGYTPGTAPTFHHTWYLRPQGDVCLVVTDEVGKGKDAAHLRETDESLMHRGHDLWLATLRWVSEGKRTAYILLVAWVIVVISFSVMAKRRSCTISRAICLKVKARALYAVQQPFHKAL
jgi:hypothetical protein